ncbi:hypothetical protein [Streptomyces bullii]|uniref:Secreted protein n=1 Tax=Streptomyces bullii TaxID=349910 RepID=A0ABW0UK47_9ACTN
MQKLKKAAAVAAMVGGMGLVGGGIAHAGGHDYDDPFDVFVNNVQAVECEQSFESGAITIGGGEGSTEANTGNFCTVIGSVED